MRSVCSWSWSWDERVLGFRTEDRAVLDADLKHKLGSFEVEVKGKLG